ncbi:unnamed protein product [Symbiodinium sp. CCMP2456]|nr:unnamed protein product [Symbiodinium sp. CCMP2456]
MCTATLWLSAAASPKPATSLQKRSHIPASKTGISLSPHGLTSATNSGESVKTSSSNARRMQIVTRRWTESAPKKASALSRPGALWRSKMNLISWTLRPNWQSG